VNVKRIVVIGASSGGIEALRVVAHGLPAEFPAAVCVVVHTAPDAPGTFAWLVNQAGPLPATAVGTSDRLRAGHIYLAAPDHHLIVEPGVLRPTKGPKENRARPAIDPLFRSAAQVFGPAAIGVVLTGSLDDGTAGLMAIKQLGGIAVVQDPSDALFPCMPRNALSHVTVDYIVRLPEMAPLLTRLVNSPVEERGQALLPDERKHLETEVNIAKDQRPLEEG
jgi:two-component system chemotaxis response regulator CheB